MIKKIMDSICDIFAEISGWLLSAIMVLLIIDFAGRGLSMPVQGVGELAVFVMVSVVYLGLAHAEKKKGHVRVNAIISRCPPEAEKWFDILVHLISLATVVIIVWAVSRNAFEAYLSGEAVAGTVPLPVWPVKFIIVIGCLFYLIQVVFNTIGLFQKPDTKP